jgi:hypothetical protein
VGAQAVERPCFGSRFVKPEALGRDVSRKPDGLYDEQLRRAIALGLTVASG